MFKYYYFIVFDFLKIVSIVCKNLECVVKMHLTFLNVLVNLPTALLKKSYVINF